jgi:hypothetical protein
MKGIEDHATGFIDVSSLEYPLLGISKDGTVSACPDPISLGRCTKTGMSLQLGSFLGSILINQSGDSYVIESIKVLGVSKPWWRPPVIFMTFYMAQITVRRIGAMGIAEVHELLKSAYKSDRRIWDSGWGDFSEFARQLDECDSYASILKLFSR